MTNRELSSRQYRNYHDLPFTLSITVFKHEAQFRATLWFISVQKVSLHVKQTTLQLHLFLFATAVLFPVMLS